MKIKEYTILSAKSTSQLEKSVNQAIERGFQPHGSLQFLDNEFTQVMVRTEDFIPNPPENFDPRKFIMTKN